jgi:uncharacterized membrane protein YkvA (DUF1232 family)
MLLKKGFWVPYLLRHPGVPLRLKVLPFLALAYLIFPRDLILDLKAFGLLDDFFVVGLLLSIFVSKAWKHVEQYDRMRQDSIDADFKVLVEEEQAKARGQAPIRRSRATRTAPPPPSAKRIPKNDLRSRE